MRFKRPFAISSNITIEILEEKSEICKDGHYRRWVKINCFNCKKEIWKIKKDIKKCKTAFCCSSCKNRHRQKRLQQVCAYCGKPVDRILAHVKNSKSKLFFCNQQCRKKALVKNPYLFNKTKIIQCYKCGLNIEVDGRASRKLCDKCKPIKNKQISWAKVLIGEEIVNFHSSLRKYLIKNKIKENKCESCGLTEWKDKPLVMHLHHKDGNRKNNKLENLEMNCPNCHTQTPTWGTKNIKFTVAIV
jgi:hypothetical protein